MALRAVKAHPVILVTSEPISAVLRGFRRLLGLSSFGSAADSPCAQLDATSPALEDIVKNRDGALAQQATFREWVAGDWDLYEREVDAWLDRALRVF